MSNQTTTQNVAVGQSRAWMPPVGPGRTTDCQGFAPVGLVDTYNSVPELVAIHSDTEGHERPVKLCAPVGAGGTATTGADHVNEAVDGPGTGGTLVTPGATVVVVAAGPPVTTVVWDVRGEPGWLPGFEVFGVAVELVADMATTAPSTATATATTNHHQRLARLAAG